MVPFLQKMVLLNTPTKNNKREKKEMMTKMKMVKPMMLELKKFKHRSTIRHFVQLSMLIRKMPTMLPSKVSCRITLGSISQLATTTSLKTGRPINYGQIQDTFWTKLGKSMLKQLDTWNRSLMWTTWAKFQRPCTKEEILLNLEISSKDIWKNSTIRI